MTTIKKEEFAAAIKRYRKEHDLTLQQLADQIPTTLNTIYRWEAKKNVPKNQIIIHRLKEMGVIK